MAIGELGGTPFGEVGDADETEYGQCLRAFGLLVRPPGEPAPEAGRASDERPGRQAEHDVLEGRESGDELQVLECPGEADAGAAMGGQGASRRCSPMRTRPVSARYRPATTLIRVDLPAPFGPISAWTVPGATAKETSLRAATPA